MGFTWQKTAVATASNSKATDDPLPEALPDHIEQSVVELGARIRPILYFYF
jgi:hypothetical protein